MIKEKMTKDVDVLQDALLKLILKVNPVTAYHRHGNKVPNRKLTELANRQIEVEEMVGLL